MALYIPEKIRVGFKNREEEELSSDVIELMTVFCAKLYGKRSHQNKALVSKK